MRKMLKRVFMLKREKVTGSRRKLYKQELLNYSPHQILFLPFN
jgi:hypothetical protein